MGSGWLTTFSQHLSINILITESIHQLSRHQFSVTRGINANPGKHLVSDNFDMFIVYVHSLGTIHLLHLVHQILLHCISTQNMEYILQVDWAISKLLPGTHQVSILNTNTGSRRNRILTLLHLFIPDRQLLLFNNYLTSDTSQNRLRFIR